MCCTIFVFGAAGPLIGLVLFVLVVLVGDQRGFVEAARWQPMTLGKHLMLRQP